MARYVLCLLEFPKRDFMLRMHYSSIHILISRGGTRRGPQRSPPCTEHDNNLRTYHERGYSARFCEHARQVYDVPSPTMDSDNVRLGAGPIQSYTGVHYTCATATLYSPAPVRTTICDCVFSSVHPWSIRKPSTAHVRVDSHSHCLHPLHTHPLRERPAPGLRPSDISPLSH